MELFIIIYVIVWILLLLFLLYMYFTEEITFCRDNWKILLLCIAFTPIIMLGLFLYVCVTSIMDKKENEDAKNKEENEKINKKLAVENLKKCHASLVDTAVIEQIGRRLVNIKSTTNRTFVDLQMITVCGRIPTDGDKILYVLDKIQLPEGHSLQLEYKYGGIGGRTYIYVKEPNGNLSTKFLDYMTVDDSPLGALQVYLLSKLWHYLPMYWHACYDERFCVLSKDDLSKIKVRSTKTRGERPLKPSDIYEEENDLPEEALACDVTPKVTRYEDKYYVCCCYWSRFAGLVRELVEIKIENNKITEFLDANREVLYRYHCGIMY